jgi:hypothetical protein
MTNTQVRRVSAKRRHLPFKAVRQIVFRKKIIHFHFGHLNKVAACRSVKMYGTFCFCFLLFNFLMSIFSLLLRVLYINALFQRLSVAKTIY